jgi:hypothetical protein
VPTDPDFLVPLGKAAVRREGSDVTIVSVAGCLLHALPAAEQLAKEGISAEIVDVRSLVPLDRATILASVAKTGRLVIADYAHRTAGGGGRDRRQRGRGGLRPPEGAYPARDDPGCADSFQSEARTSALSEQGEDRGGGAQGS